ncbi:MAG TPA: pseudouridine synthase [Verrucomicrobiae bacterium]
MSSNFQTVPPCVLHEDEHLLVVNKSAGMNTHAPSPFAGEGVYDWLKHREPRWANLAILHRLDKETSGVMVFGKSALANRSLTEQFTRREIQKKYLLLTDRRPTQREFVVKSKIVRAGARYVSGANGEVAETHFQWIPDQSPVAGSYLLEAKPLTGRTHQIRVHAAESGLPILGDALYGGTNFGRVCLHATELSFVHPADGKARTFSAPIHLEADSRSSLRTSLIDFEQTNAFRLIHGASDGWPGWYVERLGNYLLSQSEQPLSSGQLDYLKELSPSASAVSSSAVSIYHKTLNRQVRRTSVNEASPQLVLGEPAPERFAILENGVQFELSFNEGYSVGLFLDQRDNRRRLLTGHIASGFDFQSTRADSPVEILNAFAYTCGFSVCAAKSGARVTSLDLSKKYLEWGKRNFALNGLDPAAHDFIYGDAFDWMRRLTKKSRAFDLIVLDPPTFSQSKEHGAFRVEKDYGRLVTAALPLLKVDGILLASTNAADWEPAAFLESVSNAIQNANRKIVQQHYVPQPPDFPVSKTEPAYLKTVWLRVS